MTTYRVEQVPQNATWSWGVIATYENGGEALLPSLYAIELEASTEVVRLAVVEKEKGLSPNSEL